MRGAGIIPRSRASIASRVGERSSARCWRSTSKRLAGVGDRRSRRSISPCRSARRVCSTTVPSISTTTTNPSTSAALMRRAAAARCRRSGLRRRLATPVPVGLRAAGGGADAPCRGRACGASTRRTGTVAAIVSDRPWRRRSAARCARRRAAGPTRRAGWPPARPPTARLGTPRTRRTVCTASQTHGRPGGQSHAPVARAEAVLGDAVLARVVREHGDAPAGPGGLDGGVERGRQHVELGVDLDADRLERARRRDARRCGGWRPGWPP